MRFKLLIVFYWLRYKMRGKFKSREALERFQQKKLKRFINNDLNKVPYYHQFAPIDLENFTKIPLIDKDKLMAHFELFNKPGFTKQEAINFAIEAEQKRDFSPELNGITVGLSTGTSGKKGIFLASEKERAQWTAVMLVRILKPKLFKKQKIAFFLRANSNLYSSVNSVLFQFAYFDIFKSIETLIVELQDYQPDILAAQPSILMEICKAIKKGSLSIRPTSVISFAEVLHEADKIVIENTFNTKIKEVYQCMEGFLGCTCEVGTMHLNEDLIFFEKEFIDDTRFFPIITDFSRSTQYMARYRLNDILKLKKEKCPCGSAAIALELIEGRSDDVLLFKDRNDKTIQLFPDVISRKIAWQYIEFEAYQIAQTSFSDIEINIETQAAKQAIAQKRFNMVLHDWMEENDVDSSLIKIHPYDKIEHSPGSKFRKIRRQFEYEF